MAGPRREARICVGEDKPISVGAVAPHSKLDAEKSPVGRSCHIDIDDPVAQLQLLQHRRSSVEVETLSPLILGCPGFPFQFPAGRVWRYGHSLRMLPMRGCLSIGTSGVLSSRFDRRNKADQSGYESEAIG